ncbi:YcxB family protein [Abyssisolibacter fermentans]|uniref:YcxB family protein n=1 Tax=Abyssisolibacter fermentans TaxID=1766203 RepID=UPI00082EF7B2|nr:YcxB family protein [Abyssisolibacter fermentans]
MRKESMEIENNNFEINNVIVEYKEFEEYTKHHSNKWFLKIWRAIGVVYISLFAVAVVGIKLLCKPVENTSTSKIDFMSWDFISSLLYVLFMVFILFIVPWFIYPRIINKISKKSFEKNKLIKRPLKYIIDDLGFRVISTNGENEYKWRELIAVKETKLYLALYITKNKAFIIPRKFLENRLDLIRFIKSKVSKKYSVEKKGMQIS